MKNITKRILDFYDSLNLRQKLIFLVCIVLVMALIYNLIVKDSYREGEIEYSNITVEELIDSSEVIYNRSTISSIDGILDKFSDINYGRLYIDDEKVTVKDLYKIAVTSNYKKDVTYKEFNESFTSLFNSLYNSSEEIIDIVYYSSTYDIYLVKFNLEEEKYIGLTLYAANDRYMISFIQ